MKLKIWDEKYKSWEELPILAYPKEEIKKQGCIICFYTGFEDRHDQEIWEGDILEIEGFPRREKVVFWYGGFGVHRNLISIPKGMPRKPDNDDEGFVLLAELGSFCLKKICSYHENPEALDEPCTET